MTRSVQNVARCPLVFLTVVAFSAQAADFRGSARVWLGPGLDTNAPREFVSLGSTTQPDGFLFGVVQLGGALQWGERFSALGSYDLAARKFLTLATEDTLVQSAQLEASVMVTPILSLGLSARARDRRGAARDYTDIQGGLLVDFVPDGALDLRLSLSAHRFVFYDRFAYSFLGPDGTLTARYSIDRRHSISATGSVSPRTYDGNARLRPGPEGTDDDSGRGRADAVFGAGVSYQYRGPFHVSFGYSYFDQSSNSFGESVRRHRLSATGGWSLPWQLTLLGTLTWQPSVFSDGVYLNPTLSIVEDDENVSSLNVKLVRPLTRWLEVDVRYAGYLGVYPQNRFLYLRHVMTAGVSAHW
jgi:hypothetical protein